MCKATNCLLQKLRLNHVVRRCLLRSLFPAQFVSFCVPTSVPRLLIFAKVKAHRLGERAACIRASFRPAQQQCVQCFHLPPPPPHAQGASTFMRRQTTARRHKMDAGNEQRCYNPHSFQVEVWLPGTPPRQRVRCISRHSIVMLVQPAPNLHYWRRRIGCIV
jgi:hypothetical protein